MEDVDDEILCPDSSGVLQLSHRGWKEIPKQIFPQSKFNLLDLDLSYNSINHLNDSISLCIKLRRLNLSFNELTCLPDSLSKCQQLEIFSCADNKIESVPITFGLLVCLEELDLRNNRLQDVPDILSELPCMKSIVCSGNEFSFEIPLEFMSTGNLFLWYLKLRHDNNSKVMRAMNGCYQIEIMCQRQEYSLLQLEESIFELNSQCNDLVQRRPVQYLELKEDIYSTCQKYIRILEQFGKGVALAFRGWRR